MLQALKAMAPLGMLGRSISGVGPTSLLALCPLAGGVERAVVWHDVTRTAARNES
jgi:hypothetical protein